MPAARLQLHESQIKLNEAEAERNAAEAEFHRRQAQKAAAEAREAKAKARIQEISLEKAEYERKKALAANAHNHVYYFSGVVTGSSVKTCQDALDVWKRTEPGCPLEIVFNSPGGEVTQGMALYDHIKSLQRAGHRIITSTIGYAASMGGILLQAGDERIMGRESFLLIHEASFGASGSMGDVEDTVEWIKMYHSRILDIFAERSTLSRRQIANRWRRKDWWMDSETALKYGFVDSIR